MSLPAPIADLSDSESETMVKAVKAVAWSGETGRSHVKKVKKNESSTLIKKSPSNSGGCAKLDVLEVFSGSGNLSRAIRKQHLTTEEVDLEQCSTHDMSSKAFVLSLKQKAVRQNVKYCHLAPPCNTYSQARYPRVRTRVARN